VKIQERLIQMITRTNWILLGAAALIGVICAPVDFALGVIFGGLIVTVNFHLLARTLKKSFAPPFAASHHVILAKYYLRFILSAVIIFFLIRQRIVNPLGLFVGLSVVVASIMLATVFEIKRLMCKEAV